MTVRITEAKLIEAIEFVSEIIIEHGAIYAPLLDRLEQELAAIKGADDPLTARAGTTAFGAGAILKFRDAANSGAVRRRGNAPPIMSCL